MDEELLSESARLLWRIHGQVLLGVPELAQILRYSSKPAVHNALSKGRLDDLRIIRRSRRIYADFRDVADYLDNQRNLNQEGSNHE
jgi:hypothetical protein